MKDINLIQVESEQNQTEGGTIKKFIKQIYDPVEYHDPEDQAALDDAHKKALQYASAHNRQVAIDLGVSVPVDDPCFVLPGEPQRKPIINPIEYYGESPCVPEETPVQSHEIPLSLRSKFISPCHPEEPAPEPAPVAAPSATPDPAPAPAPVAAPSPQPQQPDFTPVESTKLPARLKASRPQKTGAFAMMKKLERNRIIRVCGNSVYFYTGTHYKKMSQQDVNREAMVVCQSEISNNDNFTGLNAIYGGLLSDPELTITAAEINEDFVPFDDGLLRLTDGEFLPHTPEIFTTYVLNASYLAPIAGCPIMDAFLADAMAGDADMVERLWEILGYVLTPDVQAKAAFVFQGLPSSGKSVLADFLSNLVPPDLSSRLDVDSLHRNFASSELNGRMLWISPDMAAKPLDPVSVAQIKKLTGRDCISADVKYCGHVQFRTHAKLVMVTNYPVLTKTRDDAFEQRLVAVPFRYAPPPDQQDRNLLRKLMTERNAIVRKAMSYYFRLRANNYQFTGHYRLNSAEELSQLQAPDPSESMEFAVYQFMVKFFELEDDSFIFMEDLLDAFCDWHGDERVYPQKLSPLLYRYAEELYGATKGRSRRDAASNPQYGIWGIHPIY